MAAAAAALLLAGTDARPALAADERCAVVGPMALTAWAGVLRGVASGERTALPTPVRAARDVIELYEQNGCDMPALHGALDCVSATVFAGPLTEPIATVMERCMADAGMVTRD